MGIAGDGQLALEDDRRQRRAITKSERADRVFLVVAAHKFLDEEIVRALQGPIIEIGRVPQECYSPGAVAATGLQQQRQGAELAGASFQAAAKRARNGRKVRLQQCLAHVPFVLRQRDQRRAVQDDARLGRLEACTVVIEEQDIEFQAG
ncbi:hypothetical protein D9M72_530340 [compost metagenome]